MTHTRPRLFCPHPLAQSWPRRVAVAAGLLAIAFAGCSDAPSSSGGGGGGGADIVPFNPGDGAGGGSDGGTSLDASANHQDGGGGGGGNIDATKCVDLGKGECDDNGECASDKYCDPCKRKCLTPRKVCEPCTSNVQCANADVGSVCIPYLSGGTYCGLACVSDVGCGQGFKCVGMAGLEAKQCMPIAGTCQPITAQCKTDGDCVYGTICNQDYNKCVKGCPDDNACSPPQVCSLFRCTDPCAADADCKGKSPEAVCKEQHCTIPGGCLGPSECKDKATFCDMTDHKCKPGCQTTFDCKEYGKKCEGGKCVEVGCKENWECSFNQVCVPATGKCKEAEGKFCAACDPQDDSAKDCGGQPNRCFNVKDEEEKEHQFCGIVCSEAPEGPCPQGFDCQEVKDQDGKLVGKYCLRECWKSPYPDDKTP